MHRFLIIILYFILLSDSYSQTYIAVMNFEARGVSVAEADALTDRLRNELFLTKEYKVVERGMMEDILTNLQRISDNMENYSSSHKQAE